MSHGVIPLLERALRALGPLAEDLVFVGGATIPLSVDSDFEGDARVTLDVDCVVGARTHGEYHEVQLRLLSLGFHPGTEPGDPICRYRLDTLILDVMPVRELGLGFNPWYERGVERCRTLELPSGARLRVFGPAYLFASKIAAFHGRGEQDPFGSDDLADLILLLEGCSELLEDTIAAQDNALNQALADWASAMLSRPDLSDLLDGHRARTASRGRGWIRGRLIEMSRLVGRTSR